jgi:hypothetical protein
MEEKYKEVINSNIGNISFYEFLKKESNEELLKCKKIKIIIGLIIIRRIQESLSFTSCSYIEKEIYSFLENYIDEFNFDSFLLKKINSIIENRDLKEAEQIKSFLKQIEQSISMNLLDPFYRFVSLDYDKFRLKKKEVNTKLSVRTIIQKNNWLFNKFSETNTSTLLYEEKNPVLFSQILLQNFLNFVEKNNHRFIENDFKSLESKRFFQLKELTMDLDELSLKMLTKEELLCFYINTFNLLTVHSVLMLEGKCFSDNQEYQAFSLLTSYSIEKKKLSLQKIKQIVLKLYSEIEPIKTPYTPLLTLLYPVKACKQKIAPLSAENILEKINLLAKEYMKNNIIVLEDEIIFPSVARDIIIAPKINLKVYKTKIIDIIQKSIEKRVNEIETRKSMRHTPKDKSILNLKKTNKKKSEDLNLANSDIKIIKKENEQNDKNIDENKDKEVEDSNESSSKEVCTDENNENSKDENENSKDENNESSKDENNNIAENTSENSGSKETKTKKTNKKKKNKKKIENFLSKDFEINLSDSDDSDDYDETNETSFLESQNTDNNTEENTTDNNIENTEVSLEEMENDNEVILEIDYDEFNDLEEIYDPNIKIIEMKVSKEMINYKFPNPITKRPKLSKKEEKLYSMFREGFILGTSNNFYNYDLKGYTRERLDVYSSDEDEDKEKKKYEFREHREEIRKKLKEMKKFQIIDLNENKKQYKHRIKNEIKNIKFENLESQSYFKNQDSYLKQLRDDKLKKSKMVEEERVKNMELMYKEEQRIKEEKLKQEEEKRLNEEKLKREEEEMKRLNEERLKREEEDKKKKEEEEKCRLESEKSKEEEERRLQEAEEILKRLESERKKKKDLNEKNPKIQKKNFFTTLFNKKKNETLNMMNESDENNNSYKELSFDDFVKQQEQQEEYLKKRSNSKFSIKSIFGSSNTNLKKNQDEINKIKEIEEENLRRSSLGQMKDSPNNDSSGNLVEKIIENNLSLKIYDIIKNKELENNFIEYLKRDKKENLIYILKEYDDLVLVYKGYEVRIKYIIDNYLYDNIPIELKNKFIEKFKLGIRLQMDIDIQKLFSGLYYHIVNQLNCVEIKNYLDSDIYKNYLKSKENEELLVSMENILKNKILREMFTKHLSNIKKENLLNLLIEIEEANKEEFGMEKNSEKFIGILNDNPGLIDADLKKKIVMKYNISITSDLDIDFDKLFSPLREWILDQFNLIYFKEFKESDEYKSYLSKSSHGEQLNDEFYNMLYGNNQIKKNENMDDDVYNMLYGNNDVGKKIQKNIKFDVIFERLTKELIFDILTKNQLTLLNNKNYKFGTFECNLSNIIIDK